MVMILGIPFTYGELFGLVICGLVFWLGLYLSQYSDSEMRHKRNALIEKRYRDKFK